MASFGERVVGAMRLDANTFEEVERDPTAMGQAAGVIALAAVSIGLGNLYYGGISGIVANVCVSLIGYVVWSVLVWLIGTKVMPDPATKADFAETFRYDRLRRRAGPARYRHNHPDPRLAGAVRDLAVAACRDGRGRAGGPGLLQHRQGDHRRRDRVPREPRRHAPC